jgi:DNA-binding CsgD family transcriptional regulator
MANDLGAAILRPVAHAVLAHVALLRGDLRAAAEHAEYCPVEPAPPRIAVGPANYLWLHARITGARDGAEAALRMLPEGYATIAAAPLSLIEEPSAAAWLTRIALTAGDRGRAQAAAARAEQLSAADGRLASARAVATHTRALLDGDAVALQAAAAGYLHPWAAASATEDAGVVLVAAGDVDAAREVLNRALDLYERIGADRDAARLRSRLRQVGVRPVDWTRACRPVTGWQSLTDGERQVAELVSEGLTNAQAGQRLFLSRHTVDFHLRKVFQKLAVRNRSELTRLVVDRGDAPAAWAKPMPLAVRRAKG